MKLTEAQFNKSYKTITEGRTAGEDMEDGIIALWNGEPFPTGLDSKVTQQGCQNVVDFLKKRGVKGEAGGLGSATANVTPFWSQFWQDQAVPGSTKTPKTDVTIGNKRISLKTGGAAQLMSGGKNESTATFFAALEMLPELETQLEEHVMDNLRDLFDSFAPSSVAASNLDAEIKKGKDRAVMRANRAHKVMKSYMNEVFDSSPGFTQAFAYEAMTGRYKFGSSAARAEYMLNVDWDGVPAIWEKPELDSAYTKAVANKMNLSVRFKTTSRKVGGVKTGEYKYWSVVGLVVNKMNEQLEDYDGDLNEGIADILRSAWNKIKGWVSNLLKNVIEYVKQSPKRIMDFLGIEPELEFAGTEEDPINLLDLE